MKIDYDAHFIQVQLSFHTLDVIAAGAKCADFEKECLQNAHLQPVGSSDQLAKNIFDVRRLFPVSEQD